MGFLRSFHPKPMASGKLLKKPKCSGDDEIVVQASRLRILWRLAAKDPEAAAEAQAIAETLLSRRWQAQDALFRARAAVAADRPVAAWGALSRIAEALPKHPRPRALSQAALEIAAALPEETARALRIRLKSGRPGAAQR